MTGECSNLPAFRDLLSLVSGSSLLRAQPGQFLTRRCRRGDGACCPVGLFLGPSACLNESISVPLDMALRVVAPPFIMHQDKHRWVSVHWALTVGLP